jgi:hypothetical protein
MLFATAVTGLYDMRLPQWGRCFWQAPSDGALFLAFASGTSQSYYVTSADSGVTWTAPEHLFQMDDFSVYNNFDTFMDPRDGVHCVFQLNNSGCYRYFERSGGTWTGGLHLPIVATQVGSGIPGIHASLTVSERQHSTLESSITAAWPLARVVIKDSLERVDVYHLGYPYTGPFVRDAASTNVCGASGGFPVIWNAARGEAAAPSSGACGIAYYNDYTNRLEAREKRSAGGTWTNSTSHPRLMQSAGLVPPGFGSLNFAIGSGAIQFSDGHYLVSSSGKVDSMDVFSSELFGNAMLVGTPRMTNYAGFVENNLVGFDPFRDAIPKSGIYGVTQNNGTNVDFTFDDSAVTHFFFQNVDQHGRYGIWRMTANTYIDSSNSTTLDFDFFRYPSGAMPLFRASHQTTGGKDNVVYWDKFKAAKHPKQAGSKINGISKGVFVVTQGYTSTYPSGGILTVWNTLESPSLETHLRQPHFRLDYTATSGDVGAGGIFRHLRETNVANASRWFDGSTSVGAQIVNGSYAIIELDEAHTIERVEVVASGTTATTSNDIGQIDVYGSFDATNYSLVGTIPSGNFGSSTPFQTRIRTLTSSTGSIVDSGVENTWKMEPFSAQYVKLQWTTAYDTEPRNVVEVRLFGGAATSGNIYTRDTTYRPELFPVLGTSVPETFYRRQQGSLPEGDAWRSFGNFTWSVMASGDYTKQTNLPGELPADNYDGLVPSGSWAGRPIGSGDGFAVQNKSATYYAAGATGVLEVRVNISENVEFNSEGVSGRDIGFDLRTDMHPGDELRFFTMEAGGAATGVMRYWTGNDFNYRTLRFSVPDTTYALRWVYVRGAVGYSVDPVSIGAAWVDNITGLDGPTINSINAYLKGEGPSATGMIHGYLEGNFTEAIYGYLYGAPVSGVIHGYVLSATNPDGTGIINGYLVGNGTVINGYVLGGSGVYSIPVDHIYGFVSVLNSGDFSSINGYVDGRSEQLIYGYVLASDTASHPTGDGRIHGYVLAFPAAESINGLVNGSGDNTIQAAIHGIVDAMFGDGDQVIHGYLLGPSGELSSINGWMMGFEGLSGLNPTNQTAIFGYLAGPLMPDSGMVHGYVRAILDHSTIFGYLGSEALVPSGGGLVGGGPGDGGTSTSNVPGGINWIHGYLKGHDGDQYIHGYVLAPPGSFNEINGYVLAGIHDDTIHGYLIGHEAASGIINGVLSGINFLSSSINGFVEGISGLASEHVYGYAVGAMPVSTIINGTLIGILPRANSKLACPSHTFPLVSVPVVVIPSSCMNHGV